MVDKAIKVMKNELECVKKADKCDRHCEDCPLVMEAEDIIEVYKWIIKILEDKKQLQLANRFSEEALINWYKKKYGW